VAIEEQLFFAQSPTIVIATNTFLCRIPIRYQDTAMMEFIKEVTTAHTDNFTSKIPIFHSDGTRLAVAKGNQLYPTAEGKRAGVAMRHLSDGTVCEINGKPAFEIRRKGAAALKMTAELYTFDGAFLKWSEESLSGLLSLEAGKPLRIGTSTIQNCCLQAEVGIQIGRAASPLPTAIGVDFISIPP
jgi:hypothetical protein